MNRRHFLSALSVLAAGAALPLRAAASSPSRLPKGMLTYTFDDGLASNHRYALPVLRSFGQRATAGIVVSRLSSGNDDYMTLDQVRDLQTNGWEIASHSLTHPKPVQIPKTYEQEHLSGWHADERHPGVFQTQYEYDRIAGIHQDGQPLEEVESLTELTAKKGGYWLDRAIAELHVHPPRGGDPAGLNILAGSYQREMEHSRLELVKLGLDVDTYIAPYNYWTDDVEAMSRRYYARACTGRDSDNRPATFNAHAIRRFMVHAKDSPQSLIRIVKDHALEHGGWVVFCFHGVGDATGWEPYSAEGLSALAGWASQEGVPVVTVREGAAVMSQLRQKISAPQGKPIARKGS